MSAISQGTMELHKHAKSLVYTVDGINDHLSKDARMLIAAERHDSDQWVNAEPKARFLWIKGRTKVTIKLIRQSYLEQYSDNGQDYHIELTLNGNFLTDDEKVGDMDYFEDRLVVLSAQEPPKYRDSSENPPSSAAQEESKPSQSRSPRRTSHHSGSPDQTPYRQPLQPVNRQLSVPTKLSQEQMEEAKPNLGRSSLSLSKQQNLSFDHSNPPRSSQQPKKEEIKSPLRIKPEPEPEWPEAGQASQEYVPRRHENPFAIHEDEDPDAILRGKPLRDLAQEVVQERLEAGVRTGIHVLTELERPLQGLSDSPEAQNWLRQLENVRKEAVRSRTVVGVVGNTGAGKSSVINAMLDEERLVPTNCMRACTAVVTEMSYNESTSESAKYRAEIEFIQPEDWRKELTVLFEEVFDDDGRIVQDARSPESAAGIAYAKIRAVYFRHTKEQLSSSSVESLMRVKNIKAVLGTTKSIKEARADAFYRRLQHYMDSKEKGSEKLDKNGDKMTNPKRELEYWPLIKVVKIYTKADALSTGAVIVDLPGVHDSNAARAAVAEGYMKQCTGLWIVAPINRAVDDKAAKNLLGNTFKRQLKYDGTYSAVTFICSKTDDISRTEASDSLQLGDEMQEIEDKLSDLTRQGRAIKKQLKEGRENKQDHSDTIDEIEEELEKWEGLQSQMEGGKTVYAPSLAKAKKRKRATKSPEARKKRRRNARYGDDDDDDIVYINSDTDDEIDTQTNDDDATETSRPPLTNDQIEEKIEEFKRLKKEARKERGNVEGSLKELRKQLSEIEDQESKLDSRQSELCIAGRNEYSRTAIRQDFAAGIKELDQENAEEVDPDHFDPEEDIRDYDEVAATLPVFCVSSRAYQKLCDRMQKDSDVPGFTSKEQTEIPQLQAHCKKLTEAGRQANCRRFLNSVNQLMTSLGLWASDDGTGAKLTTQQRDKERIFLMRRLKELEKALEMAVTENLDDISETLNEQVLEKIRPAVAAAASEAVPTSNKWSSRRDEGGLHFMTYRATVRRSGVYQGASGFQDFNQQLFDPIQVALAGAWEKAFQRRLPHILQSFSKIGGELLKKFHTAVESRCREKGHGISRIGVLGTQLTTYRNIFNDLTLTMITHINDGQREINREFTPVITAAMEPAYEMCADERGTGSYKRMKGHMAEHVDYNKGSMFNAACDQVRNSLSGLLDNVRKQMLDRADGVFVSMQRDYMSIIGGVNVGQITIPREERVVRRDLDEAITAVDELFQRIIDSELDDLKPADVTQEALENELDDVASVVSSQDSDAGEEAEVEGEEEEEEGADGAASADDGDEGSEAEFQDASSTAEEAS